jgi:hypothetical protein
MKKIVRVEELDVIFARPEAWCLVVLRGQKTNEFNRFFINILFTFFVVRNLGPDPYSPKPLQCCVVYFFSITVK